MLVLCLVLWFVARPCAADPYVPESEIMIRSEFVHPLHSSGSGRETSERIWLVSKSERREKTTEVSFFLDKRDTVPVKTLSFTPEGRVQSKDRTGDQKGTSAALLVSPGSPVPADILPVGQKEREKIYEEQMHAGGRVFLKAYRVVVEEVSVNDARAGGWLRLSPADDTTLTQLSVYDDENVRVAFQLWPAAGDWWLYEETPYRRSWQVK